MEQMMMLAKHFAHEPSQEESRGAGRRIFDRRDRWEARAATGWCSTGRISPNLRRCRPNFDGDRDNCGPTSPLDAHRITLFLQKPSRGVPTRFFRQSLECDF